MQVGPRRLSQMQHEKRPSPIQQGALQVQDQNAQLMQKQQAMGLEGLQSIYGTSTGAGLGYLNTADQAAQATTAANMGWTKLGLQTLAGAGGA
jgi:hypothetical protein